MLIYIVGWVEIFENENSEITIFMLKNKAKYNKATPVTPPPKLIFLIYCIFT